MADVGIRELKAHLSEYLDRAERGEVIRVTERGRPKALLMPLPGRIEERIRQGIAEGWITPAKNGPRTEVRPVRRVKAKRTIAEMLAEDRGD
jgi:prevent-host-death family protein